MQFDNFSHTIRNINFFKLVLIVAVLLAGILFAFIDPRKLDAGDFMQIVWNPGQELLRTGSVNAEYPYPLWTVVVMVPFIIWAPTTAMLLWLICNLIMLAASIVLLIRIFEWNGSPLFFLSVVILSGYFLPVLTSLWVGQMTIFSLLTLALITYTFKTQNWNWLGIVLGLSFIKPQVMILLAGFLLFWALWKRRWQVLINFGMTMLFLVLISLPFISNPNQIIGGGIGNVLATHIKSTSTLWDLLLLLRFPWWVPLIICLSLLAWLGRIWFITTSKMAIAPNQFNFLFSVTTIINLIIVPYNWMHNQALLLLPLIYGLTLILKMKSGARFLWLGLLLFIMYPLMLGIFYFFSGPLESQAYQVIPVILLLPAIYFLELQTASRT